MIAKTAISYTLFAGVLAWAFFGLAVRAHEDDGEDVERLIAIMTSAEEPWESRSNAEQKLETLPTAEVLQYLLKHISEPMPKGPIWNSGGREHDRRAPVPWQIYYASGRVWFHHTYGPGKDKLVGPLLIKLIDKATTRHGKDVVLNTMHRCWIPEMEGPVAKMFLAEKENEFTQVSAAYVLTYRNIKPYLPTLLERARAVKAGQENRWLDILLTTRVKHQSGVLKSVTEMGFKQLQAERKQAPRSLAAYGTARRLELYLDQDFVPPDLKPNDKRFFGATIENALDWWRRNQ